MNLHKLKIDPEFKTGNVSVDLQHQYFSELINRISVALLETNDDDYRKRLLSELVKYGTFHFTSEENIAFSCNIKGLRKHQERHEELLKELNAHINDLLSGRYSTGDFIGFLCDWFAGHTMHEDYKLFKGVNPY
jgi:hemerythrin